MSDFPELNDRIRLTGVGTWLDETERDLRRRLDAGTLEVLGMSEDDVVSILNGIRQSAKILLDMAGFVVPPKGGLQ